MRQILQKNDEIRMTNPTRGDPEHSEAESKDPAAPTRGVSTGFLDFARNDMGQGGLVNSAQFTFHNFVDRLELRL